MPKQPQRLEKPTLDKDLSKFTHFEEVSRYVTRGFARPGLGFVFLVLAGIFGANFVGESANNVAIVAAAVIGAYMAMNIGANDVTNNMGPAVGAKALSMTRALIIAAICEASGALLAGGNVVATISNDIIDPATISGMSSFIWAMMAALLASAIWVNTATWFGAPVSTTHSIVGGVMGAGIAAAGFDAVNWLSVANITTSWIISPIIGGLIAAAFLALIYEVIIYREDKIAAAQKWVPILIALMAGVFAAYLFLVGFGNILDVSLGYSVIAGVIVGTAVWTGAVPFIARQSEGLENRNQSVRMLFRLPLIFSAALLSFAHGANDVANAIGPLSAIVHAENADKIASEVDIPFWVMLIGALGISVGLSLFGPRLIRLVGEQITKLNPIRAYCVALSAAITVIIASWLGLPVSSTHIAIGGVFGVGFYREWFTRNSRRRLAYIQMMAANAEIVRDAPKASPEEMRRRYLVRRSHFMTIVAAWVITVPAAALLAAVIYEILSLIS